MVDGEFALIVFFFFFAVYSLVGSRVSGNLIKIKIKVSRSQLTPWRIDSRQEISLSPCYSRTIRYITSNITLPSFAIYNLSDPIITLFKLATTEVA